MGATRPNRSWYPPPRRLMERLSRSRSVISRSRRTNSRSRLAQRLNGSTVTRSRIWLPRRALAFKSKKPQNSETPKDVIATQIRSQGFGCNQPRTAERDRLASIPNEGVWLLQCEDGNYRVRLIPHKAAKD